MLNRSISHSVMIMSFVLKPHCWLNTAWSNNESVNSVCNFVHPRIMNHLCVSNFGFVVFVRNEGQCVSPMIQCSPCNNSMALTQNFDKNLSSTALGSS